jgi:CheY-like chemotaxis protein
MEKEVIILIAEDDDGHATLIQRNLKRAGIVNEIIRFKDGQEVLDYLYQKGEGPKREKGKALLLLLDIRMPKIDGVEVLKRVKADEELKKMPVMMITTTDDPREIEICHKLGCNSYISKPIDYEKFVDAVRQLGLFLLIVHVPKINGKNGK